MTAILDGNELTLIGAVGGYFAGEDCFTHSEVVQLLRDFPAQSDLTVFLNSGGGACDEGIGIYNTLRRRQGKTHVIVGGLAASAGSVIAMAGDRVTMRRGSLLMMHEAATTIFDGSSDRLATAARQTEAWTKASIGIYAAKSGKSFAELAELIGRETWFTAEEAVAEGFADDLDGDLVDVGNLAPAFAYQRYSKAPEPLVALAKSKNWTQGASPFPPPSRSEKEPSMTNPNKDSGAQATATARIKAIMKAPEAEGRQDLAEHLAYETDMAADEAIAVMKVAPASGDADPLAYRRRADGSMNAVGLNGKQKLGATGGLVAAMKQRHGVK